MKIKFITLNLYHGYLLDEAIQFLKKENPDIIALQEVYAGTDAVLPNNLRSFILLQRALLGYYSCFAPETKLIREEGEADFGNALFSRFPIRKNRTSFLHGVYGPSQWNKSMTDFSGQPKNMLVVEVVIGRMTLNLYSLHGIWGFDGNDNELRLRMSRLITDEIKDKQNVIMGGDFNCRPNTQTINNIEKYLVNVFKNELKTTFNMKHKTNGGYATAVVDMIFISPDIKVVNHYCPKVDVSDHFPLVAVLNV
ncbi:endonuclease/exonuclease/phosphatase family protein [Candidatus Roizmanbacteria bacterium]|nr:endonuclease/exonuclease/phosphatase family protein [Candidatus Roizmanbacteria bacterium]